MRQRSAVESEVDQQCDGLTVRFPTDEYRKDRLPDMFGHEAGVHRLALWKEEILIHQLSEQCPGNRALLGGTSRQAHLERRRERMSEALAFSREGQLRIEVQTGTEDQVHSIEVGMQSSGDGTLPQRSSSSISAPPLAQRDVGTEKKHRESAGESAGRAKRVRLIRVNRTLMDLSVCTLRVQASSSDGQSIALTSSGGPGESNPAAQEATCSPL